MRGRVRERDISLGFWSKLFGRGTPDAPAPLSIAALQALAADPHVAAVLEASGLEGVRWVRSGAGVHAQLELPGNKAVAEWTRLRERLRTEGLYPVLLGDERSAALHAERLASVGGDAARQADALGNEALVDGAAWARARLEESVRDMREFGEEEGAAAYERVLALLETPQRAEWPEERTGPLTDFTITRSLGTARPLPRVTLAVVRADAPWQVPLALDFGGWNACPAPEEHARLMRAWEARFGAEVVGVANDFIELRVARPPTDRAAALRLAVEHYAYCNDVVEQGTGSIEALAATLLNGSVWFFWWD